MNRPPIFSERDLVDRLSDGAFADRRKVVFIVGAPISAASSSNPSGVLDVDGIINLIRDQFKSKLATFTEFNKITKQSNSNRYQEAFKFLQGRRGQDFANSIIKKAVLAAHAQGASICSSGEEIEDALCSRLETSLDGWELSPGVIALGQIVARYPEVFGTRILTSNFDPIIELSLKKAGSQYYRTVLSGDGSITSTTATGCNVLQFHGYWHGADTLHTPIQLTYPRPLLHESLATLLGNSTVVVLAYGGWDDAFTKALIDAISNHTLSPDVLWTFHDLDKNKILKNSQAILKSLEPGL
jgi:hypothetical protein